jgi:hemerythrin-like domain-containing protein
MVWTMFSHTNARIVRGPEVNRSGCCSTAPSSVPFPADAFDAFDPHFVCRALAAGTTLRMATTTTPTKKVAKRVSRSVTKKARRAPKVGRKATRNAVAGAKAAGKRPTRNATPSGSRKNSTRRPGLDAIAELKRDHRNVAQLFKRFEKAGDGAHRAKRALVDSVIEELSRHAAIEELVMYPAIRREMSGANAAVLEALEEHHSVKVSLHELEGLDPSHERFDAKMTVLIEHVRHHVREEEQQLFPEVRTALGRRRLLELGTDLRAARRHAPTRPHPAGPDEPPANALIEGAAAVIDRARTVGRHVVDRVRDE